MPASSDGTIPLRVWLIDHDVAYRAAFCAYLNHSSGICCEHAFDSVAALLAAAAATPHPDVIVLEVRATSGARTPALTQLRAAFPASACLNLVPSASAEARRAALAMGGVGCISRLAPLAHVVELLRRVGSRSGLLLGSAAHAGLPPGYGLTPREQDVLGALAEGLSQKEIAQRLQIGASTVNSHVQRLFEKLRVHTATAAVAKAVRESLV